MRNFILICIMFSITVFQVGCTKSIHQLIAQAGDAENALIDGCTALYQSHDLGKSGYQRCTDVVEAANKKTDELKQLAVQIGTITAANSQPLVDKINQAIAIFAPIATEDIKDPVKKAKYTALITAVQDAFIAISVAFSNLKGSISSSKVASLVDEFQNRVKSSYDKAIALLQDSHSFPFGTGTGTWNILDGTSNSIWAIGSSISSVTLCLEKQSDNSWKSVPCK